MSKRQQTTEHDLGKGAQYVEGRNRAVIRRKRLIKT